MSDLSLDPKEITKSLQDSLKRSKEVKNDLVGHVLTIADGCKSSWSRRCYGF